MSQPQPCLEGMLAELIGQVADGVPPETTAALAIVYKRLEARLGRFEELGPPGSEARENFLRLLERDFPAVVYCPWCRLLHPPENAVAVVGDDSSDDGAGGGGEGGGEWPCRALSTLLLDCGGPEVGFPSTYHPLVLYGLRKALLTEGRQDTAKAAALEAFLATGTEISGHPSWYVCERNWSHRVNSHGVFVAKRQRLVVPVEDEDPQQQQQQQQRVFTEQVCRHASVKVRFAHLRSPECVHAVVVTQHSPCLQAAGKIHGCSICGCDFRVEVKTDDLPGSRPAVVVVISTWYHLGQGKSPDSIAKRQCDPSYREITEGNLGVSEVARLSGLLRY